jgi:hypothetical protein
MLAPLSKVIMRIVMLAGALAAALAASVPAAAESLILTYHGAPDRSGMYVMPGLTYERARSRCVLDGLMLRRLFARGALAVPAVAALIFTSSRV